MNPVRNQLWNVAVVLVIMTMLLSATFVISAVPVLAQQDPPPDPQTEPLTLDDPSDAEVGQVAPDMAALVARAEQEGPLGIIVVLKTAGAAKPTGEDMLYATAQDALTRSMAGYDLQNIYPYQNFPLLAMKADAAAIRALLTNPLVEAVQEDTPSFLALDDSTEMVGAVEAAQAGYTGDGMTVAILDTGVDRNHPFLAGRVAREACFSGQNNTDLDVTTLCPDGQLSQFGTGAATPCSLTGCDHGTHVAGIAAGQGASFSGVARDASIIAINIFSNDHSSGTDTLVAFESDYLKAMDYVYDLHATNFITSVNLSIGNSGKYTKYCDATWPALKKAVDDLRSINIATIIASGNNVFTNAITAPGCISSAISVGATTKSDSVASFSNSASFLKLLAPGQSINSSLPGGGYGSKNGTSMAAAHVTGAWAVLRQAYPTKSVSAILSLLQSTGVKIKDTRNRVVKSRINLVSAIGKYTKPGVAPTLASPANGTGLDRSTPELVWYRLPLVTRYKVVIKKNGLSTAFSKLYPAETACLPGSVTCWVQVPTALKAGTHTWTVQPYTAAGAGPTSAAWRFNTPAVVPTGVEVDYPQGNIGIYSPDFKWEEGTVAPFAARYTLRVYNSRNQRILNKVYDALKICIAGFCKVTKPLTLTEGDYRWEVLPWNPVGFGPIVFAPFNYHYYHGYSNTFSSNKMGFTTLYPLASWWWLDTDKLITLLGNGYTWTSARVDATYPDGAIDMTVVMYREGKPSSANCVSVFGNPTLRSGTREWKNSYDFCFNNDGQYSVWKTYNHSTYTLQPWTVTSAIISDDYNVLQVAMLDGNMYFLINAVQVWSGQDHTGTPPLTRGSAGIQAFLEDWNDDYLYIENISVVVPDTSTLEGAVSPEQQALNEAALANPAGSKYATHISAEMAERLANDPGRVEWTFEDRLRACLAAGDRCALPFSH